jgi:hypothetical protein
VLLGYRGNLLVSGHGDSGFDGGIANALDVTKPARGDSRIGDDFFDAIFVNEIFVERFFHVIDVGRVPVGRRTGNRQNMKKDIKNNVSRWFIRPSNKTQSGQQGDRQL